MSLASRWVQRLRTERGYGPVPVVQPERCLRRYASSTPCDACSSACPVSTIAFTSSSATLDKGCIGCEACVTACPTGALHPPRQIVNQRREKLDRESVVVGFTCVRQPGRGEATVTVGCLAGLPVTTLLAPLKQPNLRIEVERGGCAGCGLAAIVAAFDATLKRAKALLTALDVSPSRICEVEQFSQEAHAREEVMGRREFLLRLRPETDPAVTSERREEKEPQLASILGDLGAPIAGALLPKGLHVGVVRGGEACFGCNVCETVCPTAALRIAVEAGVARLLFTPARCTGCGVCAEACITNALSVTTGVDAPLPLTQAYLNGEEEELAEISSRTCSRCGAFFSGLPGELCAACLATHRLRGLEPAAHGRPANGAASACNDTHATSAGEADLERQRRADAPSSQPGHISSPVE